MLLLTYEFSNPKRQLLKTLVLRYFQKKYKKLQYLKQKILFLEKSVQQLEKERSEFSVRATMAEEQLNSLQEHMSENTKQYQKKILELSKELEASDIKGNKYFN